MIHFTYLKSKWKDVGTLLFSILGIAVTLAELTYILFNTKIVYEKLQEYNFIILICAIAIALWKNKLSVKTQYVINNTDIKINLIVGDILATKSAVVIPTNSTFDTRMDNQFISINSVQGQFQNRYFKYELKELDHLLGLGLIDKDYQTIKIENLKSKRYPIGTVSKVNYMCKHYYFVAIADINKYGKPYGTKFQNVQDSLEGLWSELENRGHIEDISIPLIGTGKAGIKDATRERVLKEIVFSFIASASERKVTECINIYIHPSDLNSGSLVLEELQKYLEYMCKYKYNDTENGRVGKPMC